MIYLFSYLGKRYIDFVHEKRHMDILESSTKRTNSSIFVSVLVYFKSICNCMSIVRSWPNGLAGNSEIRVLNYVEDRACMN